jgi:hypothetical protein
MLEAPVLVNALAANMGILCRKKIKLMLPRVSLQVWKNDSP